MDLTLESMDASDFDVQLLHCAFEANSELLQMVIFAHETLVLHGEQHDPLEALCQQVFVLELGLADEFGSLVDSGDQNWLSPSLAYLDSLSANSGDFFLPLLGFNVHQSWLQIDIVVRIYPASFARLNGGSYLAR